MLRFLDCIKYLKDLHEFFCHIRRAVLSASRKEGQAAERRESSQKQAVGSSAPMASPSPRGSLMVPLQELRLEARQLTPGENLKLCGQI